MSSPKQLMVFMCVNVKEKGKCCAMFEAQALYDYFKAEFAHKKHLMPLHTHMKIIKTSCLGQCAVGPNIYVSPQGVWYHYQSRADIDEILHEHLINGRIVERLINPGIHGVPG